MGRRILSVRDLSHARQVVDLAWEDLPPSHRALLEAVGAQQLDVIDRPLGQHVHDLARSAGIAPPPASERAVLDRALGTWVQHLGLVLIDVGHPALGGLDGPTYEGFLAHVAWHEWAHALSLKRATDHDVDDGARLLAKAPSGITRVIRAAGYRSREYTHELVADIYALLMLRRRQGEYGRPSWLDPEIYDLIARVTGWSS